MSIKEHVTSPGQAVHPRLVMQVLPVGAWQSLQHLVLDGCSSLKQLQLRLPSLRTISLHSCTALQVVRPC